MKSCRFDFLNRGMLRVAILFAVAGLLIGCQQSTSAPVPAQPGAEKTSAAPKQGGDGKAADAPAAKTVELTLDYGDGFEKRYPALAWRESMTAFDALQAAAAHPHGISLKSRGSGEGLMVTKIDDVENGGGADDAKNWIFFVNGRMADRSSGVVTLKPGDRVMWKFGKYE